MTFGFNLIAEDRQARLGEVITSRGKIDTPVFMPVGTYGAVTVSYTHLTLPTKA